MRKAIIAFLVLVLAGQAFAVKKTPKDEPKRTRSTTRVYVQKEQHSLGWYITPTVKIAEIRGVTRGLAGLRAGLILDRSLYVGLAGYGMADPDTWNWDDWDDYYGYDGDHWELGYGGLELGILSGRGGDTQLGLGVLVGGGEIDEYFDFDRWHRSDGFFIVEPNADLLFHFNRHVALNLGFGYRFVDGVETPRFTDDDLDGPSFNISLQLGSF